MFTPIIDKPDPQYLIALAFILSGIFVYIPFVYMKMRPQIMDKITHLIQKAFLVAPTKQDLSKE